MRLLYLLLLELIRLKNASEKYPLATILFLSKVFSKVYFTLIPYFILYKVKYLVSH